MKKIVYSLIIFFLLVTAFPATVSADSLKDDKVVLGGSYSLDSGETLDGSLIIIGGTASLAEGSTITGDVVLTGGTITAAGTINGDIVLIGGSAQLKGTVHVLGNMVSASSTVSQDEGATIDGKIQEHATIPFLLPFSTSKPSLPNTVPQVAKPKIDLHLDPLMTAFGIGFRSFVLAILAMLLSMFFPNAIRKISRAILTAPIASGGIGFLTAILAPLVLVLIAITLIGIPITILGALLLAFAVLLGWVAIGVEIGTRIAEAFKSQWHIAVCAGVGTLLLTLVTEAFGKIPCVGWIVPTLVGMLGLGAVILTRSGTREYETKVS